jgi:hypothetical protein
MHILMQMLGHSLHFDKKGSQKQWCRAYLGMSSGRAGSGQASKKPNSKTDAQAQPDCRAMFFLPGRAIGPSGQVFLKSSKSPAQAQPVLSIGPDFATQTRPVELNKRSGQATFEPGQVGPLSRAAHAQVLQGKSSSRATQQETAATCHRHLTLYVQGVGLWVLARGRAAWQHQWCCICKPAN